MLTIHRSPRYIKRAGKIEPLLFFIIMDDHFIQLIDVTKIYHPGDNPVLALDHIHLNISKGEFVAVTGKSGCGKSTLINIVGGLDSPNQGQQKGFLFLLLKSVIDALDQKGMKT